MEDALQWSDLVLALFYLFCGAFVWGGWVGTAMIEQYKRLIAGKAVDGTAEYISGKPYHIVNHRDYVRMKWPDVDWDTIEQQEKQQ